MTIKTKLIANVLVISTIIVGISLSSFFSMNFLQKNLAYLIEKSTPFQMRSMEFQRELQSCITGLIKVNSARNMPEYTKFRGEAERSLANVRSAQDSLKIMSTDSSSFTTSEELGPIANELFAAAEERIKSDMAAGEANAKISQQMKETTTRLKELEVHIHNLQVTRAASFAEALRNTDRLSTTLLDLQELRNYAKDLISASSAAHSAQNSAVFLTAKGKINSLVGRISKNESATFVASDIKAIFGNINAFLQRQATAVSQKDDDSKIIALDSLNELTEKMTRLNLKLNQEIELSASRFRNETGRQEEIFRQSNIANAISLTNSELVALGFTVTGETNRLFSLGSTVDLDKSASDLSTLFATIEEHVRFIEDSLAKLDAKSELQVLHKAYSSLAAIRSKLYSAEGIVIALKKKLNAIEQSNRSADTLQTIIIKQSAKGNESVASARSEQEKSIITVNSMVRRSMFQVIVIGTMAIAAGIFLGLWIYRSVMRPLRVVLNAIGKQQQLGEEKATLAEAVARGNLNLEVTVSEAIQLDQEEFGDDEMGLALSAVVTMSETQATLDRAFAGMTESLRNSRDEAARRDHLKNGLYELNKILRIEHKTAELADEALAFIADYIGAGVGIMYLYDEEGEILQTLSTYAISKTGRLNWGFPLGEGLPGQVALERKMICLKAVPPDYLPITSALGQANPMNVAIMPIIHNDRLAGVLEIGSFKQFSDDDFEFLQQSMEGVAIAININHSRQLVNELLEKTQTQTEELHAQQDELHQTNEELVERARMLEKWRK